MPHKRSRAELEARDSERLARQTVPCLTGDRSPEAILWSLEALRAVLPSLPLAWLRQALRRLRIIVSELEVLVEPVVPNGIQPGRQPFSPV